METELKAGREMDAEIHQKVLDCLWYPDNEAWRRGGYHTFPHTTDKRVFVGYAELPRYSTEIAAAWLVVEHLRQQGWIVRVQEMPDGLPFGAGAGLRPEENQRINRRAVCMLYPNPCLDASLRRGRGPCEFGDAAPEAICRAALATRAALKAGAGQDE